MAEVTGSYSGGHHSLDVLIQASMMAGRAQEPPKSGVSAAAAAAAAVKESVYRCPVKTCEKTFTKKWNLKVHVRLHTGDEPFKCSQDGCGKTFRWRSSLKSHEKTHENGSARRKVADIQPSSTVAAAPAPSMAPVPAKQPT